MIKKTVSFSGGYNSRTFADLASGLWGGDGYLTGAACSDYDGVLTIGPYSFVQSGVVVVQDTGATGYSLAGLSDPIFVLASSPDDDPATGVNLTVTSDLRLIGSAVVLAFRVNNVWQNPLPLTTIGQAALLRGEPGKNGGFVGVPVIDTGTLSELTTNRGQWVTKSGVQRNVGAGDNATIELQVSPEAPHASLYRNDYMLLRESGAIPASVQYVPGDTVGAIVGTTGFDTGAGVKKPSFLADPATPGSYFVAWGNSPNLRLGSSAFSTATVLTGSGTIDNVEIAQGFRPSDSALIIVYTDGNDVRLVAVDSTAGTVIDGPITIDTQPNACIHAHIIPLAFTALAAVTYQHDEGGSPPNQQIYVTTVDTTTGSTFGTHGVSPILANGVNSAKNDTWPTIAEDSAGTIYIAYTTGNSSDEYGELRLVVLEQDGTAVSRTTYSTYGGSLTTDADPAGMGDISGDVDYVQKPHVAVTAQDEVYITCALKLTADGNPKYVAIASPLFLEALGGFGVIQIKSFMGTSLVTAACTGDALGHLVLAVLKDSAVSVGRLEMPFARFGVIGESLLGSLTELGAATNATDVTVTPGAAGAFGAAYLATTTATMGTFPATVKDSGSRNARPHPNDTYLSCWTIAPASGSIPEDGFQVFNTRPKKMNYPFLVGDEGDYQGYNSLGTAVTEANRRGGDIVARGGEYVLQSPLVLQSGVRLRGESLLSLVLTMTDPGSGLGYMALGALSTTAATVSSISSQIITLASPPTGVRPGDLVKMATSGLHRVRRVLTGSRLSLDGVTPVGGSVIIYSCGNALENVAIRSTGSGSAALLLLANCFLARVAGLEFSGAYTSQLLVDVENCKDSVIEDVDFTLATGTFADALHMAGGLNNQVRSCRFLSGSDASHSTQAHVLNTEDYPHFIGCVSNAGTAPALVVDASRGTRVILSGSYFNDVGTNSLDTTTFAARHIRTPAGALVLHDQYTDNVGTTGIPLTDSGAGDAVLNGAATALVPAVNERVKKSGDTMSGDLLVNADGHSLGNTTDRWDAALRDVTVATSLDSQADGICIAGGTHPFGLVATQILEVNGATPTQTAVEVTGANGQSSSLISIFAGTGQAASMEILFNGDNIATDLADGRGHRIVVGQRLFDDFFGATGDLPNASFWTASVSGAGFVEVSGVIPTSTIMELATDNAVSGDHASLVSRPVWSAAVHGTMRARVQPLPMGLNLTHAQVFMGFNNLVRFEVDEDAYGDAKFHLVIYDNASTPLARAASSLTVTAGHWYLAYLQMVDGNRVFWGVADLTVGGELEGQGGFFSSANWGVATTGGTGTIQSIAAPLFFQAVANTTGDAKVLNLDFVEAWGDNR